MAGLYDVVEALSAMGVELQAVATAADEATAAVARQAEAAQQTTSGKDYSGPEQTVGAGAPGDASAAGMAAAIQQYTRRM